MLKDGELRYLTGTEPKPAYITSNLLAESSIYTSKSGELCLKRAM
jgi:hypothetical protein